MILQSAQEGVGRRHRPFEMSLDPAPRVEPPAGQSMLASQAEHVRTETDALHDTMDTESSCTGGGAPPPPRTDADTFARISMSSLRCGRRRGLFFTGGGAP